MPSRSQGQLAGTDPSVNGKGAFDGHADAPAHRQSGELPPRLYRQTRCERFNGKIPSFPKSPNFPQKHSLNGCVERALRQAITDCHNRSASVDW
ncbi:MAG TPA: hypothetical protein VGP63_15760, partial [Planctomycetaceae bacterium]|nr:hypothetical protein [Planctomycetaceae bacterium]